MQRRMDEIQRERQLTPLPPVVLGGVLVVPVGLIRKMTGASGTSASQDTQAAAARARAAVMKVERELGFEPVDREFDKLGYDIESRVPGDRQDPLYRGERTSPRCFHGDRHQE